MSVVPAIARSERARGGLGGGGDKPSPKSVWADAHDLDFDFDLEFKPEANLNSGHGQQPAKIQLQYPPPAGSSMEGHLLLPQTPEVSHCTQPSRERALCDMNRNNLPGTGIPLQPDDVQTLPASSGALRYRPVAGRLLKV